ncbi:MAG: ADP-ribose pyrophosphatase [Actinomycetales bacterium]|nr:MAG: ADP-ribose pyrophosphatase [Actinomycetales bacterium]
MTLAAPRGTIADLIDERDPMPVIDSEITFHGLVFDVRRDQVDLGDAGQVTREYLDHPGAVVVLAWHEFDGVPHLLLVHQYRHATGTRLWELPAGLLDVPGEPPWRAAARELAEEGDLVATTWHVLSDDVASPGILPEWRRVFLARDLGDLPEDERHTREGEEHDLRPLWVPFDDAVEAVITGRLHNASTVAGILAADAHRRRHWVHLRPFDAPWPEHPAYLET